MRSVLSIAGSDSSGGAGIQADIKTIEACGLFAQTAVCALTAQNTLGVNGVLDVPATFVAQQIDAVFSDIRPDAVKVGMLSSPEVVEVVASSIERWGPIPLVVDPVMISTSGASLISSEAFEALCADLLPLATLITPNIPEAEALLGAGIATELSQERAAQQLARRFDCAVLVKGGHGLNDANDVLALPLGGARWLRAPRIDNPNTHGTGCTLSSAIACGLAEGRTIAAAVREAKDYLSGALSAGLDLGKGSGPLMHFWQHAQR
ncbi:bifunctional hydroxymethylpyrimidine kinase/phosphomethylpyrimidine kinase [Eggerthellaceae bacterium zg-1084]|uniref:Bifunctional hydroxymethylpyrimidine kinase/phosphomethylpyrimidine kinase n=1 Tax=Berryella wangjianweii TaxID=2734634 RepID=A0A6M8J7V3_9ACTN|nr:bifunctional hydroxymethylpyrimidine kinase/phosphomethylpyrimidine kinase [Berryella wangjianweii]NPD31433.1 bifunctional hydroxymethylpyrimidine kinase/phosphomethylpyrimidine kinase [Berryella wangjianweii]NPD33067.1 bifunctional hydroxymethylpyrimidine kinase/phosphomethylpyrimidine kinase [Eggerthellaceae bacterium zg-997]QKF07936.1 bifunctional hydroxymethylpyrimidine kinase/phosphomethylpyrimidine kinase [Berryella wangjianweii]